MVSRRLSVYCGSSRVFPTSHRQQATRLGVLAATHDIHLIYGGAAIGMMGALADSCLAQGGRITGICPRFIVDMGVAHPHLTELKIVDDMHQRQSLMRDQSDAAIALPGGSGTLDEISETLAWKHLSLTDMPLVLLDCHNYWRPLRDMLANAVEHGYMPKKVADSIVFIDTIDHIFEVLQWH